MKVQTHKNESFAFKNLSPGDCFLYSGNVYIKISPVFVNGCHSVKNAVRLSDAYIGEFDATTVVTPRPDATVTFEK